jgi:hypothetical protein
VLLIAASGFFPSYLPSAFINSSNPDSGIMPMNRNVQSNRVNEDWTVIFLQSVLQIHTHFAEGRIARVSIATRHQVPRLHSTFQFLPMAANKSTGAF